MSKIDIKAELRALGESSMEWCDSPEGRAQNERVIARVLGVSNMTTQSGWTRMEHQAAMAGRMTTTVRYERVYTAPDGRSATARIIEHAPWTEEALIGARGRDKGRVIRPERHHPLMYSAAIHCAAVLIDTRGTTEAQQIPIDRTAAQLAVVQAECDTFAEQLLDASLATLARLEDARRPDEHYTYGMFGD